MRKLRIGWLLAVGCLLALVATAHARSSERRYSEPEDRRLFEEYMASIKQEASALPMGELMTRTALLFLDKPYVASTLEKEPEGLVINLRELDCTTFMETTLALCRTARLDEPTFDAFCDQLRLIRYREGEIHDYADRLHYMTDWLYVNQQKGIVEDVNQAVGGEPLPLALNFISTHPDSYKQLKGQPELTARIAAQEQAISARSYYYLPKEKIESCAGRIQEGDIVCFVTSIKGLDVTHVGITHWRDGQLTFIHASMSANKVIVNPESLADYAKAIKSCRGILVIRPSLLE